MLDYENYPPQKLFEIVLNSYPHVAMLYVYLWKKYAEKSQISIRLNDIKNTFFLSTTLFRNQLVILSRINILSFEERENCFIIRLNDDV